MIKVSVAIMGLKTKEEYLELAQKLYAEKRFVKYIDYEHISRSFVNKQTIEEQINEIYDMENFPYKNRFVGVFLSIHTKSPKILKLLNEFIKNNHYDGKYEIWRCNYKLHGEMPMTLDELLEKYSK